jgi:hypothetical protein
MSTKTKNRIAKGQNGTPEAPTDGMSTYDKLQASLLEQTRKADGELARRCDEHEQLAPLVYAIIRTLCNLDSAGQIYDVKLKHFEPGEYGDTGNEAVYPERIEFSWSVKDYDHRYSNAPDFSITLMGGMLQY